MATFAFFTLLASGLPHQEVVERAEAALRGGDLATAESLFRSAASEDAAAFRPRRGLCRTLRAKGPSLEALTACRDAHELRPSEPETALALGTLLARRGAVAQALEALGRATVDEATAVPIARLSSLLARDLGDRDAAIAHLQGAVDAGHADLDVHEELAFLLLSIGAHDVAASAARAALVEHPRSGRLQLALGIALARMQPDSVEAADALRASVSHGVEPEARARAELGAVLLARGDTESALEHLSAAVELEPEVAEHRYTLGQAYARAGDPEAAAASLERFRELQRNAEAVEITRRRETTALNEAQRLALDDRLEESLSVLDALLADSPDSGDAHGLRAKVLASLGRLPAALVAANHAARLAPGNVEHEYLAARLLARTGQAAGAEARLRGALATDPDYTPAVELLGVLVADRGDPLGAIALYERALALGASASVHLNLAEALDDLGRTAEAERHRALYEAGEKQKRPGRR